MRKKPERRRAPRSKNRLKRKRFEGFDENEKTCSIPALGWLCGLD